MFTKKTICEEIRQIAQEEINPVTTELMTQLMIIHDHCHLLPGGEEEGTSAEGREAAFLEWVDHMENADGTTGPHWSRHEAEVIRAKYGIASAGDVDFYVVLNMMYSDYCTAAAQAGASTVELFARMTEAFLTDPDAQPDKLGRYYRYIARHG